MITSLDYRLVVIFITLAYLLGSISSAILLCRLFNLPDPRSKGSKNPGTTNVLRIAGKRLAATVLLLDILKGLVVVWLACWLNMSPLVVALSAFAVFLGQLFPVFFHLRGGKGVAVTLGIMLGLSWKIAVICLATWIIVFIIVRISSLAAIFATVCSIVINMFLLFVRPNIYIPQEYAICIIALGVFILIKHKRNMQNLLNNAEGKV